METKQTDLTSLKARLEELKLRAEALDNQLRDRSQHAEHAKESPLDDLHAKLMDAGTRLRDMEENASRADDASLLELKYMVDQIYGQYLWWPGKGSD